MALRLGEMGRANPDQEWNSQGSIASVVSCSGYGYMMECLWKVDFLDSVRLHGSNMASGH